MACDHVLGVVFILIEGGAYSSDGMSGNLLRTRSCKSRFLDRSLCRLNQR